MTVFPDCAGYAYIQVTPYPRPIYTTGSFTPSVRSPLRVSPLNVADEHDLGGLLFFH